MIEVKHLTKRFGDKTAVDDISFSADRGEVLGLLGPNAAGKTTTMRMITGYLPPTWGSVSIGGKDIVEDSMAAREKIGYLPENAPVYPDMTVIGFLDFIAQIRGFSGQSKLRQVEETLARCFLSEARFQTIHTLSKGFKQRVCFAQCILHDPEYLIMDEPTDGLDPNQKHEVRSMIRQMAGDKTILLSTHNLEEVEAVCTRAVIISNGKIAVDETPEKLKTRSLVHGAVRFNVKPPLEKDLIKDLEKVEGVSRMEIIDQGETMLTLRAYPKDPMAPPAEQILRYLAEKGFSGEMLYVEEGRLDEVFRMITTSGIGGS
jgi:ABC-2 type transport system ATP-binding protein